MELNDRPQRMSPCQNHEEMVRTITRMEGKMDTALEHSKETKALVEEMARKLWVGNGSPSIVTRLDRAEQELVLANESRKKHAQFIWGIGTTLAGSIALALLKFVAKVI